MEIISGKIKKKREFKSILIAIYDKFCWLNEIHTDTGWWRYYDVWVVLTSSRAASTSILNSVPLVRVCELWGVHIEHRLQMREKKKETLCCYESKTTRIDSKFKWSIPISWRETRILDWIVVTSSLVIQLNVIDVTLAFGGHSSQFYMTNSIFRSNVTFFAFQIHLIGTYQLLFRPHTRTNMIEWRLIEIRSRFFWISRKHITIHRCSFPYWPVGIDFSIPIISKRTRHQCMCMYIVHGCVWYELQRDKVATAHTPISNIRGTEKRKRERNDYTSAWSMVLMIAKM